MQVFDLNEISAHPYGERNKNVLYESGNFKVMIIELSAGGEISPCEMTSHVIFYIISGKVEVSVNKEQKIISGGQCLITEPATLSMKTETGVKIMGVQIESR